METVRFADILFIFLVCVVTFGILVLVNRKRSGGNKDDAAAGESTQNGDVAEEQKTTGED